MISFNRVSLIYPHSTTTVIEELSFTIDEGEMVLVMGRTGSGKSSLLRLINGLVPHHTGGILAGEITVDGLSTRTVKPGDLSTVVGIVGQNPIDGFVTDTVEEELAFGMEVHNFPQDVMRKRVEEALDLVGLAHLRNRTISTLSGGEQQRLAIACALVMHPKVLVLDEPTSALDPIASEEILAILQRLVHDLSVTVILAEHRLERVIGYVDRIILIEGDGKSSIGKPEEILPHSELVPPIIRLTRALQITEVATNTRELRKFTEELRVSLPDFERPVFTPGAPILKVENLSASYDGVDAVKKLSFVLHEGEITALMGRNGAGKSTLIRNIVGIHKADSGSVTIGDKAITQLKNSERAGLIGYVPQEPGDLLYLTSVDEECARADRDNSLTEGQTFSLLSQIAPHISPQSHPRELSEGQRLSLVLAIALGGSPRLSIRNPIHE